MADAPLAGSRNRVLSSLADGDMRRMSPHLRRTHLKHETVLYDPGTTIDRVYFMEDGMVSLLAMTAGTQVETALVGSEGMCGMSVFHEVHTASERAVVLAPGWAQSMDAANFREVIADCPSLRLALHHFSYALFALTTQCSACNRRHKAAQRLARWLLMAQDRIDLDVLPLTHLLLSQMLGIRRSTVSQVAEELKSAGVIQYSRGNVRIVNRRALEQQSCECYTAIVKAFDAAGVPARV